MARFAVFAAMAAMLFMLAHWPEDRFDCASFRKIVTQDHDDGGLRGMRSATPSNRFAQIDALRGVAALLVVWLHSVQFVRADHLVAKTTWAAATLTFIDPRRVGVVLFF